MFSSLLLAWCMTFVTTNSHLQRVEILNAYSNDVDSLRLFLKSEAFSSELEEVLNTKKCRAIYETNNFVTDH